MDSGIINSIRNHCIGEDLWKKDDELTVYHIKVEVLRGISRLKYSEIFSLKNRVEGHASKFS